ncbi:CU044_5270 family protein [Streptomyces sp. NPDC020731]|uniref:CU044_5270 family protein n=1 Tax=Streptomyces sp. NPDC020731 TaxID=3365085 RepID=UPI003798936F
MTDELDLLRRANPVPDDGPHFGDGPLDHRAERRLGRLMDDRRTGRRTPLRLGGRFRPAWALAAVAVVAALTSVLLLGGPAATPAIAAPRPLAVLADSTPVPLDRLAERAATAAADGTPALRQGTHVQSWSLGMSDGEPPLTLPEERIVRWTADGRHTELVVATDPRHPGRPVLTDEDGEPRLVDDGQVISRGTFPPSWSDAPPAARPPHDTGRLRAYLAETVHGGIRTTPELLDATVQLLDHWTLGARESAALARLLADADGLRPAGGVTDRLGRSGQTYVYDDGSGVRHMLILDPSTGAVLGLEETFTTDQPEYGVRAGDVMQYSAWMR